MNLKAVFRDKAKILYLEYAGLALLVLLPLLRPGYVLALDMVFTPTIRMATEVNSGYAVSALLHFLNFVIPSQVIQKILLFLIVFLSGIGMHRLIPTKSDWPRYFGALLYIFNPFVYDRFVYGQLGLLMGYALTPFFAKSLLDFLDRATWRRAISLALLLTLIAVFQLHTAILNIILACVAVIVVLITKPERLPRLAGVLKYGILAVVAFLGLNIYWLIPTLSGKTIAAKSINAFSKVHLVGFKTVADNRLGVLFNTAAMYGFWGENEKRFVSMKQVVPYWDVMFVVLFAIIVTGVVAGFKNNERRSSTLIFVITGVVAFILAVGVAYPGFSTIFWFLDKNIPLFSGFRESQKFVALLVLAYGYFGGLGLEDILARIKRFKEIPELAHRIIPVIFLVLPIIYAPLMLWGFGGQLKAVDYPRDWYEVNQYLNKDKTQFKVLFLPWHEYMGFTFAGKIIYNPAKDFFDKPIIQGDNIEFGPIYTQVKSPTSSFVEKTFVRNAGSNYKDIAGELTPYRIKYVILAKESDYKNYEWLDYQKDIELVKDTETLSVYSNRKYK